MSLKVVHFGISGFPYKVTSAPIQKSYLVYKGLIEAGDEVLFINAVSLVNLKNQEREAASGVYDGIRFVYTSGTPYRPDGILQRNWLKLVGMYKELRLTIRLARRREIDIAILYTGSFLSLLYYRLLTHTIGVPIVMNYVEYRSSFKATRLWKKIENSLTDRFSANFVDGVLPISEFLVQHVQKQAPQKPILKIPVLCNFSRQGDSTNDKPTTDYLLYCGSAAYYEVVQFIISSFELLPPKHQISLYLIINGWPRDVAKIQDRINQSDKKDSIKVFSDVPNQTYAQMLAQAKGLLIPLRPIIQDQARFPNKIGEYLASGNPIVTTAVGEINHYFTDGHDALIAEGYDQASFSEKMKYIVDRPAEAAQIGLAGKEVGLTKLDYQYHGRQLSSFLRSIVEGKH